MAEPTGVLLMAYGTPAGPDDVEPYYTHIRRGRTPAPEQLADLRRRYDAIGGISPLRAISDQQVAGVQAALDAAAPGAFRAVIGMKHATPFIEDAVARLRAEGITRAVALVLAPHYSRLSVEQYLERALAAGGEAITITPVRSWHLDPGYLEVLAGAVTAALGALPAATHVLFTAHSLPARIVGEGDPYPRQLRETAEAIASQLDLPRWSTAWQSAGATSERWLGPDVLEAVRAVAGTDADGVLVCACGFVADHLEVLYDLDVEAVAVAREVGLEFARTRMPNADPAFTAALARVIATAAAEPVA